VRFRGQRVKTIRGGKPIAYTIDRSSFDAFLLDRAVDQGTVFFPEERVISIQQDDDRIIVETNHNQYRCQYLVGSDGVHSVVAKQAGLMQKRRTSLAYEAVVSPSLNANGTEDQSVTFDFGTILFGYGWVFPKRDHLNVGVFRSWPGKCTSKKHLLRFIDQHPALNRDRIINIRAFPVPLGGEKTSLHLGNILLTGDAANLADPWLGEGLYYAILSGHLAAESIQKHICGEIPDMAYYTRQVNERIVKQFVYARWLSLLVNALPLINVALLKASPTLQKLTINLLRGDQTYQAVWQNLKHLPFKILSKII
jgi:geranylgeranyl reductase family protein